jgi:membrane associated rhomboid family serine protease
MLSDRPYMRDDYQRERTSFLIWLLSAIIAGFILQTVLDRMNQPAFERMAAVSAEAIKSGHVWTLVTYPFLHDNILHVLVVGLSLFFVGRELIQHVGERRMAWLTLAATVVAGLSWFALNFGRDGSLIGATSILLCYFTVFACLFPNREISFLVFFVLPVTTRPKYVAWLILGLELFGFAFNEIPGGRFLNGIPHSAHLGAILTGWLYFRFVHEANWLAARRAADIDLPRWMKRTKKAPGAGVPAVTVAAPTASREDLRAEVDRILDKINSHGFGALTPEEKRRLDDAKDMLSRR